jgi:inner membrane protein
MMVEEILIFGFIAAVVIGGLSFPIWLLVQTLRARRKREQGGADPLGPPTPEMLAPPPLASAEPAPTKPFPEQPPQRRDLNERIDGVRLAVIALVAILMLVPLGLITSVIQEREELQQDSAESVRRSWGGEFIVSGPVLVVPVSKLITVMKEETAVEIPAQARQVARQEWWHGRIIVLPETMEASAQLAPEIRSVGPYEHVLYRATSQMSGTFDLTEAKAYMAENENWMVHWDDAQVMILSNGLQSFDSVGPISFDGLELTLRPARDLMPSVKDVVASPVALTYAMQNKNLPFSVTVAARGSESFSVAPVGRQTNLVMTSSWTEPGFRGSQLPVSHSIDDQGFRAQWTLSELSRSYPQVLAAEDFEQGWGNAVYGVELFQSVDFYSQLVRSTKYGILFIFVTYALLVAAEFCSPRRRLHVIQYGLVGVTMSVFYLTLLSLAVYTGFGLAYLSATLLIMAMVGGYVGLSMRSVWHGAGIAAVLAVLYGVLYLILRQGDYALQAGTALVIATLILLMAVTRNLEAPARPEGPTIPPQPEKKDATNQ